MEVLKYLAEVTKWEENTTVEYTNLNANMSFGLVLSKPGEGEPEYSYFAVSPQMVITNGKGQKVFTGETKSTMRLTNHGVKPKPEILYEMITEATRDFANIFKEREGNNQRIYHPIPQPLYNNLLPVITECIGAAYGI